MIDIVKIALKAGDGGKGAVAWRHEKYYPNGGPFGGDGGKGGNIYFQVDTNETTLSRLRFTKTIKAGNGMPGLTKKMHGKSAADVIVKVPLGTMIRNADSHDLLADLTSPDDKVLIAKGGRGGLGNMHFATARNDTPEYAQPGEIGESLNVIVELRLLADAGLIGFPSVGKSTLLSVLTNAKPDIAAYPFTTIEPNVGVVSLNDGRSFVLADMPGLIEGAKDGKGLGHEFLRHIQRCRVLIHVIDMAGELRNPIVDYKVINDELFQYDPKLKKRPQIIVANKMDDEYAFLHLEEFKKAYPELKVYEVSAITHQGLEQLVYDIMASISHSKQEVEVETPTAKGEVIYRFEPKQADFKVVNIGNGKFRIDSAKIDHLFDTIDFDKPDEAHQFALILHKMGVDTALKKAGAKPGDAVIVGTFIMEYSE